MYESDIYFLFYILALFYLCIYLSLVKNDYDNIYIYYI
jgi:hypothetical protein